MGQIPNLVECKRPRFGDIGSEEHLPAGKRNRPAPHTHASQGGPPVHRTILLQPALWTTPATLSTA
jgi:hypothetical protein